MSNTKFPRTTVSDTPAVVVAEETPVTEVTQVVSQEEKDVTVTPTADLIPGEINTVEVIGGTERLSIPVDDENGFGIGGTYVLNEDGSRTRVVE